MNGRRRVAITGVGAVTPVGVGAPATWDALLAGRSGIGPIESFDTSRHRVRIAGEIADFDPADWFDVRSVKRLDRFCQLALVAAEMAVADARIDTPSRERFGTVFASGIGGVHTIDEAFVAHERYGPHRISPLFVPCAIPNMAAGQIAMRFGFGGPNTCPVTACAASTDAVGMGFRLVRDGYADACLVGGSESCVHSGIVAGFANLRALSTRNDEPERASRPFDARRDGFVLAEGAGALMLEPLDDALARGADAYAEVAGFGQASDAFHETAPDPDGAGAARAIRAALEDAGVAPEAVDYVNAHGTSTPLSDATETKALRLALGAAAGRVSVSSTKSMTGHMLGATGAVESIVCALAIREGRVPPTINHEESDPDCDLDYVPNRAREMDVRVALSNSMGFGGHDACLVLRAI